jgi:hypothetical protein
VSSHEVHVPTREELLAATSRPIPKMVRTVTVVLAAIGLLVFVLGLFVDADRVWRAWHFNWLFFATISSAGVMFVAAQRITTARWSRPVIRFMEGYAAFLPIAFVFLLLTMTVGAGHVFPWTHETPPVAEKQGYLRQGYVATRDLVLVAILFGLQLYYIYTCLRLDVGVVPESGANWARGLRERMRRGFGDERRELHTTHSRQGRLATVMALVFGYFWCLLSVDLSMALDMHFQSTLYGWWFFMTGWLGALTSFALLTMWWRTHLDAYDLITENHFHDIGKLCFAFTVFWTYLSFSQYLVMWYGNMAEETHWWRLRFIAPWKQITFAVIPLVFLAPFFGLMSRAAKVYLPTLALFATSSLVGTWLQRYTEVYPSLYGVAEHSRFGIWEIGVFLLYLGTWGLSYIAFMDAFPRMRVLLSTSPYRDEVQVPVDPRTMEPLPAHE